MLTKRLFLLCNQTLLTTYFQQVDLGVLREANQTVVQIQIIGHESSLIKLIPKITQLLWQDSDKTCWVEHFGTINFNSNKTREFFGQLLSKQTWINFKKTTYPLVEGATFSFCSFWSSVDGRLAILNIAAHWDHCSSTTVCTSSGNWVCCWIEELRREKPLEFKEDESWSKFWTSIMFDIRIYNVFFKNVPLSGCWGKSWARIDHGAKITGIGLVVDCKCLGLKRKIGGWYWFLMVAQTLFSPWN